MHFLYHRYRVEVEDFYIEQNYIFYFILYLVLNLPSTDYVDS